MSDALDRVVYLDAHTEQLMEGDFPQKTPDQLRQGMSLRVRIRGKGHLYFRVVRLEKGFVTRVYLKRIYIHYMDVLKLLLILALGKLVFQVYVDFLWPK